MKNVLELLERTAARLPRQTAFADQQCSYDYQTVVNIAGSVGSALAANGDRNCPVAVLMERGAPCLVTLMGVLYSGNFYVVLDPEMPAERVNKILRTLQPTALICDEAHKDDRPDWIMTARCIAQKRWRPVRHSRSFCKRCVAV